MDSSINNAGGTSKTGNIKSLLLEAWRERWTEIEWGINIKRVLPRGVSGDVYDLADCILQQSLIGPIPNSLMISYLNHSISSRTVSYGAVLSAVSRYDQFDKLECVTCLLDLVKNFKQRIGCYGNEEECVWLCKSIVALSAWLFSCLSYYVAELKTSGSSQAQSQFSNHYGQAMGITGNPMAGTSAKHIQMIEKICDILAFVAMSPLLRCLFYIGKTEDPLSFNILVNKFTELESKPQPYYAAFQLLANGKEVAEPVFQFLRLMQWNFTSPHAVVSSQLQNNALTKNSSALLFNNSVFSSLNAVIAFDAVLYPISDPDVCAEHIMMIAKFNRIPMCDLYLEIIRACFVGQVDAGNTPDDLKWSAFTFLKMPQVLSRLHAKGHGSSADVEIGLEKLLTYTPLLDLTDSKSNCDCLKLFLTELAKTELLSEQQMKKITSKRQAELSKSPVVARADHGQSGQPGASLIPRAEPTVNTILKTLDMDYSKNQDALLKVLCPMSSGRNFLLILNAAAATEKLRSFVTKLIKFNESSKQAVGESGKASQTRALVFDISFLMLCHIAQNYGTEIITENDELKDSFFASWASQCLPEGGQYRSPDIVLASCDPIRVDLLLNQFTSTDSEFKTSLVKWNEVCLNSTAAIKEVLLAWEHGAISTDNVKVILDNIKSRMCCLPVILSAWLCSYINILHHEERLKPMNMLQQFMTPLLTPDGSASGSTTPGAADTSTGGPTAQATTDSNMFYKERSTLMANIIRKMLYDLHPPQPSKSKGLSVVSHGLTSKRPLGEILEATFTSAQTKSWLDLKAVHSMDTLLNVGGPDWFVESLVRQLLKYENAGDLDCAVALVYGLFHLDIEQCAMSLLTKVLPSYLLSEKKQEILVEPKASALARLVVMSIYTALSSLKKPEKRKNQGRKRSSRSYEQVDLVEPMEVDNDQKPNMSKGGDCNSRTIKCLNKSSDLIARLDNTPYGCLRKSSAGDDKYTLNLLGDPFTKAVANFLLLLSTIVADCTISQRTLFPLVFFEQLILCVEDNAREILQFLPHETIMSMIKTSPESISYEFLLAISDIQTSKGRKVVAKALCQLGRAKKLVET